MNKVHRLYQKDNGKQSLQQFIQTSVGLFIIRTGNEPTEILVHPEDITEAKKVTGLNVAASNTVPRNHLKIA